MGLIHIYTGEGKGKTTAALGLGVRAAGNDMRVCFAQFLKGMSTSEEKSIKLLPNITHIKEITCKKFTFQMNDEELSQVTKAHTCCLEDIIKTIDLYDVLILDEIISTYNLGLVDQKMLLSFLKDKPQNLEIIMTGREPAQELIDLADYVSEIKAIKHPYEKGFPARRGIEF